MLRIARVSILNFAVIHILPTVILITYPNAILVAVIVDSILL